MPGPILDVDQIQAFVAALRRAGKRVVLTNGVFDLLHVGHLRSLRAARAEGDALIVGVNVDATVRSLKPGGGRPLVPEAERAELVAALEPVDAVVVFAEPTADALLRLVRPDVYVKGGDYADDTLPERVTAREVGAEVRFLPLVPGRSTTDLLRRLRAAN